MASLEYIQEMFPEPIRSLPTHMDYKGQKIAEWIFQIIITISAIVGFIVGYHEQRYSYTVYCTLGGFFLSCLVVLPPWPCFRVRKDLKWQKVLQEKKETSELDKTAEVKTPPASGKSSKAKKN